MIVSYFSSECVKEFYLVNLAILQTGNLISCKRYLTTDKAVRWVLEKAAETYYHHPHKRQTR